MEFIKYKERSVTLDLVLESSNSKDGYISIPESISMYTSTEYEVEDITAPSSNLYE
jgi:hypothetical protein